MSGESTRSVEERATGETQKRRGSSSVDSLFKVRKALSKMLSRVANFAASHRSFYLLALVAAMHLLCASSSRAAETSKTAQPARPGTASPAEQRKRVLLLFAEDQSFPMITALGQSIRSTLSNRSASRIDFFTEYLDRARINDAAYEAELFSFWRKKYEGQKVDLIVVCIASALDLLSKHQSDFFPGAPVVYCVLFEEELSRIKLPPGATGVWSEKPFRPTLECALKLHPDTKHVSVIYGSSDFEQGILEIARGELRDFESEVEIDYLTDLTMSEMQARLASLPEHTIVLFGSFAKDSAGAVFTGPESLSRLSPVSPEPMYGFSSTLIGSGIVGGSLIRFELLGESVAESGARILAGERPQDIASHGVPTVAMFDWREVQRWGISEKNLVAGSQVLFREQTFFERHRFRIAAGITLLVFETLLIAALLVGRARRVKVEEENASLAQLAEREHRRMEEVVSNVPGIVWETRSDPGSDIRRLQFLSNYAETLLGYSRDEWFSTPQFWLSIVCEQDREKAARDAGAIVASGKDGVFQFPWKAKDGRLLWAETHLNPILDSTGVLVGVRGVTQDITERKRVEEGLRQSEEKNRDILRAIPDLMFLTSPEGDFLDYHAGDPTKLLVPPPQFLGKNMRELLPKELAEDFFRLFADAKATGEPQLCEYLLPILGKQRWFEARIVKSGDNILSVIRDITDRKQTEEALRQNRMRLSGIVESAMDAIISVDDEQRIVLMNPAAEQMFGCPADSAIGQSISLFIPERFREAHVNGFRSLAGSEAGSPLIGSRLSLHGRRSDGEEFPLEASISQIELGGHKFYTAILRDVTERIRSEEAIRESEANYRSIFNAVNDAIFVHDPETGSVIDVNQVMCEMYGVTAEEARTLGLDVLSSNEPPYTREAAFEWIKKAMAGEPQVFEWRARDKAGRLFWVEVSLRRSVIGGKDRVLAVVRDITFRKHTDEVLRESEERFRSMADTAPVMIWVSGPDRKCTYFNQRWLDFTGRTLEELLGDGWIGSVHPDDCEHYLQVYDEAFGNREPFTMEYRLRGSDGEFRWIYNSGAPRSSSSGKFLGYIGSCIDITERKAAEEVLANLSGQLIRAREEECARIARELHDDLNQRMALVSVELEQLGQNAPHTPDQLRKQLQEIRKQTTEISREIHRMSYDLHPSKLVHLGLVAAVKSLCDELRASHGLKTKLIAEAVPSNLSQDVSLCLYRIVQECLNNVVRHSGVKEARLELRGTGDEVRIHVSDSGVGFDIESPRIKRGLGLLSMRERLRLVGGKILIESSPSRGTQIDARVSLKRASLEHEGLASKEIARGVEG